MDSSRRCGEVLCSPAMDGLMMSTQLTVPLMLRRAATPFEHVVVVPDGYEKLLAGSDEAELEELDLAEEEAAAMCYTSGTTARPKGVLYSHRALVLHTLASAAADMLGIRERDVVLPVVP